MGSNSCRRGNAFQCLFVFTVLLLVPIVGCDNSKQTQVEVPEFKPGSNFNERPGLVVAGMAPGQTQQMGNRRPLDPSVVFEGLVPFAIDDNVETIDEPISLAWSNDADKEVTYQIDHAQTYTGIWPSVGQTVDPATYRRVSLSLTQSKAESSPPDANSLQLKVTRLQLLFGTAMGTLDYDTDNPTSTGMQVQELLSPAAHAILDRDMPVVVSHAGDVNQFDLPEEYVSICNDDARFAKLELDDRLMNSVVQHLFVNFPEGDVKTGSQWTVEEPHEVLDHLTRTTTYRLEGMQKNVDDATVVISIESSCKGEGNGEGHLREIDLTSNGVALVNIDSGELIELSIERTGTIDLYVEPRQEEEESESTDSSGEPDSSESDTDNGESAQTDGEVDNDEASTDQDASNEDANATESEDVGTDDEGTGDEGSSDEEADSDEAEGEDTNDEESDAEDADSEDAESEESSEVRDPSGPREVKQMLVIRRV